MGAQLGLCVGWIVGVIQTGVYAGFLLSGDDLADAAPSVSGGAPGGMLDLTGLLQVAPRS